MSAHTQESGETELRRLTPAQLQNEYITRLCRRDLNIIFHSQSLYQKLFQDIPHLNAARLAFYIFTSGSMLTPNTEAMEVLGKIVLEDQDSEAADVLI